MVLPSRGYCKPQPGRQGAFGTVVSWRLWDSLTVFLLDFKLAPQGDLISVL